MGHGVKVVGVLCVNRIRQPSHVCSRCNVCSSPKWGIRDRGDLARREVKGDDLLYRFFNEVLPLEPDLFLRVPKLLVISMGVWFPVSVYTEIPILLPWVVRDPKCRGKVAKGKRVIPDEWGAPNEDGCLRDDNSLVKGLPKSLKIESKSYPFLNGKHLGNEFVASHIWRENRTGQLASRIPSLNTFVPNLVWLPSQVAKLSDREGGAVQNALKEVSWSIYRHAPVQPHLVPIVEKVWSYLDEPKISGGLLTDELNWFIAGSKFMQTRRSKFSAVIAALESLAAGGEISSKLHPTRFREGLPRVAAAKRFKLLGELRNQIAEGSA